MSKTISEIIYTPLMEEEEALVGWSKQTIDYVLGHKSKIQASIRGIAKGIGKILQKTDVEDVYMELLNYLYTCEDYDISKAIERSNNAGVIVSVEGYVFACVKYCVIRFVTNNYNTEKKLVHDIVKDEDGKELSLFDTIADKKDAGFDDIAYDLEYICRAYESQRYKFGPDLFTIWYVRLLTMQMNKEECYNELLTVLGITRRDMLNVEKHLSYDGAMLAIAKAVSLKGVDESIEVLKNYTYYADRIENLIKIY